MRPYWCQDFLNDPATAPWHERGARSGWAASAALPLYRQGIVIGAFILDSDKAHSFDQPARDLLVEMAGDISFALDGFVHEIQRRQAADEIEHLAFYDPLTSLPNRRLLHDRLRYALAASARHRNHGAVLFIDLDDFKSLNDTKGHNIGDLLLIEVAARLQACMRGKDTVARVGGDEFVVILEELSEDPQQAVTQTEADRQNTLRYQPTLFATRLRIPQFNQHRHQPVSQSGEHDGRITKTCRHCHVSGEKLPGAKPSVFMTLPCKKHWKPAR